MKREHLARRLTAAGAEQRRRRLEVEAELEAARLEAIAATPPRPRPAPSPKPRRRARRRRPPPTSPTPAPNVGGRTPWYVPGAVPISVHVAHWAFVERDGDATAAAQINRAAADLADELEPIGLTPQVTPYRPVSAAARERDRLL